MENERKTPVGPEEGLKSASTAGDNHGATADSDFPKEATRGEDDDKPPAERREDDLRMP